MRFGRSRFWEQDVGGGASLLPSFVVTYRLLLSLSEAKTGFACFTVVSTKPVGNSGVKCVTTLVQHLPPEEETHTHLSGLFPPYSGHCLEPASLPLSLRTMCAEEISVAHNNPGGSANPGPDPSILLTCFWRELVHRETGKCREPCIRLPGELCNSRTSPRGSVPDFEDNPAGSGLRGQRLSGHESVSDLMRSPFERHQQRIG
jgi:hypothetical protein